MPCQSSTSRKYARLVMPTAQPHYTCARSARNEAKSCSVFCFSGGAFPSAAVHLSVSAACRRTLFIKVSLQDMKHLQIHELLKGTLTFIDKIFQCLVSAAAWVVSVWCFSFSSTCQSWDSTSPDSFTSLMRIIRKCKWTCGSFLGFIGAVFLTVVCVFQVWHVGSQLCVYTDGNTDPDVPGSGLWFGSCREPGTGHWDRQL